MGKITSSILHGITDVGNALNANTCSPLCNIHIDTLVLDMYIHPRHIRYEYVKKKINNERLSL